jgi:hypothetical protein
MYYISQPPGVSLEDHITLLEQMYAQCFEDKIDAGVMADIWNQIQVLHERLKNQAVPPVK